MGHRRNLRRRAYRGGNCFIEPRKRDIVDSDRPRHHALSAQLNRSGRRGKHRASTITKPGGGNGFCGSPEDGTAGSVVNVSGGPREMTLPAPPPAASV